MAHSSSRRGFSETIASAGVAAGTLATLESARGFAANDSLTVGCLGTGGRCQTLMKSLAQVPGVKIAAVCDVYDAHACTRRAKLADSQAVATKHYREVLDRKDIDAVLIASPDHWHVPMTVDACNAGKDVYVEKPLTHDLAEGAAIIEAQNRNQQDRAGRHAAAQHAAHPEGPRAGQERADRRALQDPPDLEPRRLDPFAARSAGCRSSPGRLERLPRQCRQTSRSTSIASATGAGSGTSAAAFSPT